MLLKALSCGAVLVGGVLAVHGLHRPPNDCPGASLLGLTCASVPAEAREEEQPAPSGTWGKKDAELKIEFVDKNVLKIIPHADSTILVIVCEYTVEKGGVIWACVPDGDANKFVVNGRVFAFDAEDFSDVLGDGDHRIKRLWMSDPHYTYNKFNVPVVNGGRLYVPTYAGTVDVYGV